MKLRTLIVIAAALFAMALPAAASAAKDKDEVTVMSRNVYLGADLTPAINATTLEEAIDASAVIYREVERTNFPERAVALADEIKGAKVDLVGLQEVANWREQVPGDGGWSGSGGVGEPAEVIKYDFLKLLTDELGKKYKVVGVQQEFDAELPVDLDGNDDTGFLGGELDARLTMRDVILKRKGVKTKKVRGGNYENRYEPQIGGAVTLPVDRGWISTHARVDGAKFRFVNTHLEAFSDPAIREAQAEELVAGPLRTGKDVVLVGDMNSDKDDTGGDQGAYEAIRDAGFVERQVKGGTSGHDDSLTDPNDQNEFRRTIDLVFVNNKKIKLDKKNSELVGRDDPSVMTPSGLWPSDHAGVVSSLLFP